METRVEHSDQITTENMPETEVKFGWKTVQTRGLVFGHVLESTETLIRSEETLAHTSLVTGKRAREIGKKGSLDDRISGDRREQIRVENV